MFWAILIIMSVIIDISITTIILIRNEIKGMTDNLKEINEIKTNKKIMLLSPNRQLENLAKEINRTIEQKQQLEIQYKNMDAELRKTIANISHDLRTPLTSIIGYIQLIKDETLPKDERDGCIDIVEKRAKSLQTLISSFFDLSRLEAKEYNFELKPVNLQNILCELLASFYNDFINSGIEPIIDIDETAQNIIADENAIRRILTNLILNALKHGKGFIHVLLKQEGKHIIICFTNDAPSLTEEDTKYLFERFFTADRMRTGQNTGLGLAITKSLVEQMGYRISASLKDGRLSIVIEF